MNVEQKYLEVVKKADILGMVIEVYGNVDKPLFLANDIADRIGYRKDSVNKMLEMVDFEDEKLNGKIFRSGQNRNMWFLTEEGVYSILMKCGTDEGKKFRNGFKLFLKAWRKGEVKVVQKQMSELDMIISMANIQKEIENRVETLEDKVNKRMTVESGEQNIIHSNIKRVVYKRVDQLYNTEEEKKIARKLIFPAIHKEFRNKFGIVSYKDVKVSDYDDSLLFIKS
ncbi:BRO family protein, partial [Cetobacterium sp.]|uniref:BRO family protein n=1 Tax=Cetobacterium sp. TaxID=2071632 RepID=UPI003F3F2909